MKKPYSYSNRNKIYKGIFFFFVEGFWAENVQNLKFLLIQKVGNVFNISLFLEVLLFLCVSDIWNRVQIIFFLQFLYFFTKNFWGKVDMILKVWIRSSFVIKIWIFWPISRNLHHWPQFLISYFKNVCNKLTFQHYVHLKLDTRKMFIAC